MEITKEHIETISTAAGKAAARETLISMGVDPDDPKEMQADFAWMRRSRTMSEKSWVYIVGAVLGGMATLVVTHLVGWLYQIRQ